MNNTATNTATCPTVRKQIGKTTYIVRVHFSETAKETMEDKIKRMLREEVRKMMGTMTQGICKLKNKDYTYT